jgi:hypothetical protein
MSEIIIFSTQKNRAGKSIKQIVNSVTSERPKKVYTSISKLAHRLQDHMDHNTIGIFLTSGQDELFGLSSIQHLFRSIRVILVVPDREHHTLSKGFSLKPRYLSYADGDLSDVAAIMGKMVGRLFFP